MATPVALYRVIRIELMKGRRLKMLVLERIDKPRYPRK